MPMTSTATRPSARQAAPTVRRSPWGNLRRFVRTPKGTLLWVLLALAAVAMAHTTRNTPPVVGAAVLGAAGIDLIATRVRQGRFLFPSGAILTGLIVAMVLARQTPAYAVLLTAALAAAGKHALRTRWSNIFNPAVLGLLIGNLLFRSGESWWGALPYYGLLGFALVLAAAWYIAAKVNKLPLALTYLGVSLVVFTAASFSGAAAQVAQVFRAPDINALLFFACIMLTDPPTSPARHQDQCWFGALAALVGSAIFLKFGVQWFIIGGLPAANLAESLRRLAVRPPNGARPATALKAAPPSPVGRAGVPGQRGPAAAAMARTASGSARTPTGKSARARRA